MRTMILAITLTASAPGQPLQWIPHPANGHEYALNPEFGLSWHQHRQAAQALGADLVVIETAAENHWLVTFFSRLVSNSGIWIGLSDAAVEGDWRWVDGTAPWNNWAAGEPNNCCGTGIDADFGQMYIDEGLPGYGRWDDDNVMAPKSALYERPWTCAGACPTLALAARRANPSLEYVAVAVAGPPASPLVILASLAPGSVPIPGSGGTILGHTQISLTALLVVADGIGVFGAPDPGAITDGFGLFTLVCPVGSAPLPPIYAEAFAFTGPPPWTSFRQSNLVAVP